MNIFSRAILSLFILALITAGISPACKFISGKSIIEICAADGSIQQIEVLADLDPFAPSLPSEHKTLKNDCGFCFFQSHLKSNSALPVAINAPAVSFETASFLESFANEQSPHFYHTRAPPTFS